MPAATIIQRAADRCPTPEEAHARLQELAAEIADVLLLHPISGVGRWAVMIGQPEDGGPVLSFHQLPASTRVLS